MNADNHPTLEHETSQELHDFLRKKKASRLASQGAATTSGNIALKMMFLVVVQALLKKACLHVFSVRAALLLLSLFLAVCFWRIHALQREVAKLQQELHVESVLAPVALPNL